MSHVCHGATLYPLVTAMASLRLATALRSSVHRFHLSRTRNYTVALTPSLLSRTRGSVNSPTLSFIKAHVSTTADAGTSTSKDVPKIVTSSPSTNTDSSVGVEPFGDGNSNGGSNGTGVVGNGNGNGSRELQNDWSKSYHGLSSAAFAKEVAEILQAPVELLDIEMKPGEIALCFSGTETGCYLTRRPRVSSRD